MAALLYMLYWHWRAQQAFSKLPLEAKVHPHAKPLILRWPLLGIALVVLILVHVLVEYTRLIPARETLSRLLFASYLVMALFQFFYTRLELPNAVFPAHYVRAVQRGNSGDVLLSLALLVEAMRTDLSQT